MLNSEKNIFIINYLFKSTYLDFCVLAFALGKAAIFIQS